MHKFPLLYKRFSELPLEQFNTLQFSIYVLDFHWNYLFVNDFVKRNLGSRGYNLIGKNLWVEFKELANDPVFKFLRKNIEKRKMVTNVVTTSPINAQRLNITGYPLEDCYYFSSSILPAKDALIHELRSELKRNK